MPIPQLPYQADLHSRPMRQFLLDLRINFVCVDTSTGPQTINLAALDGLQLVIKDVTGNATANPITLTNTVDGVVNPTITTDYDILKIFNYKNT